MTDSRRCAYCGRFFIPRTIRHAVCDLRCYVKRQAELKSKATKLESVKA